MSRSNSSVVAVHRGRSVPPRFSEHSTVNRERLFEALDDVVSDGTAIRVVSITAPAGSGKTVLLSSWARRLIASAVTSVAWLTIDDSDNDVNVLRAAISAALASSTPGPQPIRDERAMPSVNTAGAPVGQVLDQTGALCLIIDDAHLLHDVAALNELGTLLRWAPDAFRVAIAGRFELPLVLAKLRVAGSVLDVSAAEMDFTDHEARELLSCHGLDVSPPVFEAVMAKTEGWAAGLALTALTALRSRDPVDAMTRFGDTDRAVSDYLVDEFISSLPPATKSVLIATALPDAITAAQAIYISDSSRAIVILEALTRSNFLITRTSSGADNSYSYHPMMRAYLRAEAQRLDASVLRDIHCRNARWFLDQRFLLDALFHAIESDDGDVINEVIDSAAIDLVLGDHDPQKIVDLLDRAPEAARSRTTTRLVIAALQLTQGHRAPAAATMVAIGQTNVAATYVDNALATIIRAQVALRTNHVDRPNRTAVLADLEQLQSPNRIGDRPDINTSIALHQAVVDLTLGRLDDAAQALEQAESHSIAARSPVLKQHCLGTRNILALFTGGFREVIDTAAAATRLADVHLLDTTETLVLVQSNAAYAAFLRSDSTPPTDQSCLSVLTTSTVPAFAEAARLIRASIDATALPHLVADHLRPRYSADRDPLSPHMRALMSPVIQHKFLLAGNATDAAVYAAFVRRATGDTAESALLAAMVERFRGRNAAARKTLAPVLDGTITAVHSTTLVWAWLEEAALTAHSAPTAFAALDRALTLAAPEELIRPFTFTRHAVRGVLDHNRGRFGSLDSFADLVRIAVKPENDRNIVRLSRREMDLLRELPSFRTAEAIAVGQFISVNTVKTHLRGIYRKLGVTNRRDAILAAQKQGLI